MSEELANKTQSKHKNYEVDMTVRIHANSPDHARMKLSSNYYNITEFKAEEL